MDFNHRFTDYFRLSISNIEKKLGLSTGYISNFKSGKIKTPSKLVFALKNEGLNPDYFLTGEGSPELLPAVAPTTLLPQQGLEERLVPYLSQMVGATTQLGGRNRILEIPGSEGLPPLWALQMPGDNMTPTIRQGDVVICTDDGYTGDGLYVYRTAGFCQVKRLMLQGAMWHVTNDNPAYPSWNTPVEELDVVGRIVYIILRL